jgi:hypothetical protein
VQDFVSRKSQARELKLRLHAIWSAFLPLGIYGCKIHMANSQVLHSDGQRSART